MGKIYRGQELHALPVGDLSIINKAVCEFAAQTAFSGSNYCSYANFAHEMQIKSSRAQHCGLWIGQISKKRGTTDISMQPYPAG
jgi:hypothetical protein